MVKNLPLPNNTTITVKNKKQSKWLHVFKKKKKLAKTHKKQRNICQEL